MQLFKLNDAIAAENMRLNAASAEAGRWNRMHAGSVPPLQENVRGFWMVFHDCSLDRGNLSTTSIAVDAASMVTAKHGGRNGSIQIPPMSLSEFIAGWPEIITRINARDVQ